MIYDMSYGEDYKPLPLSSIGDGVTIRISQDVFSYTNKFVNVVFIGDPKHSEYIVIDAGVPGGSTDIVQAAEAIYGHKNPKAIVLTHGHFDHVGSIIELIDRWQVDVYAHSFELPYLIGKKDYPQPDPSVEGGLLAKISSLFPNESIQIQGHVFPLNEDGTIPFVHDFKWIHTPGHSPGHISLFRERDKCLIVGDAFTTVRQDKLYDTLFQKEEISGPPRYFTTDWDQALRSIIELQKLDPDVAITGHGVPISGEYLKKNLDKLVDNFNEVYKPDYGKFINE